MTVKTLSKLVYFRRSIVEESSIKQNSMPDAPIPKLSRMAESGEHSLYHEHVGISKY